jgi:hypothetical protein
LDLITGEALVDHSHSSRAFYEIPYQKKTYRQADKGGDERQVAGPAHEDGGTQKRKGHHPEPNTPLAMICLPNPDQFLNLLLFFWVLGLITDARNELLP